MAKLIVVESSPRRARGSRPPRIGLGAAVDLITAVYERAGGTSTFDELSEIMGNSRSSSAFQQKLTALRSFGLVETDNDRVSLSPTAETIVAPEDPDFRSAALKEAFLRIEPFAITHQKYVGKILPQDEFLKNSFLEFGRDLAEPWMKKFKESAEAAGLLMDRGDGKLQVRESGKTSSKQAVARSDQESGPEPNGRYEPVSLVLPSVSAAKPAKTEYQMLIDILDAEMTTEEQAAVWTLIQYLKKRELGEARPSGPIALLNE